MFTQRARGISFLSLILLFSVFSQVFSGSGISEKDLRNFGVQIQNSLSSQNPYYFNLCFDTDQLLYHVFDKYGQSPYESFHQGFIDGIKNNLDLGTLIVNDLYAGSSIELVSVRKESEYSSLIYRLIGYNGINYHEYFVEEVEGKLKITDAYIYSTGQRISETIGQLYVSSWFNIETSYTRTIEAINQYKTEGRYKKAYRKWSRLPEYAKIEKTLLLTALDVASRLDAESFYEVYNLFSIHYPNEPGKYLIPLDGLITFGLHERALESIDSLDMHVQQDPILNFARANIYYAAEDVEKAEQCLSELITSVPDFQLGYFSLLDIYLRENMYSNATLLLNQMVLTFNNYKEDYLPLFADYPDFVSSPEFQAWLIQ